MPDEVQDEPWRNTGEGKLYLTFPDGRDKVTTVVHGGQVRHFTPQDRRRISAEVADADRDPFRNGSLFYEGDMQVFGTERERQELASNPNVKTAEQLAVLAKAPQADFEAAVGAITNPVTVSALLGVATESGAPPNRLSFIQDRLNSLRPIVAREAGDPDMGDVGEADGEGRKLTTTKRSARVD